MLYGIGSVNIGTNALDINSLFGQNICFPQCTAAVAFNSTSNFSEAKCYVEGILQTIASAISAEDFTLDLTYEYLDWPTLQLLYGELAKTGGAAIPTAISVPITANEATGGTPGNLPVADISTANANGASVRVYDQTQLKFLSAAVASPPGADEFFVDEAAGTIEFNPSQVGSTVSYKYDKLYTSIESIGSGLVGEQTDLLSNLNLTAILASAVDGVNGIGLVVDKLERTNTPSLSIAGDKAVVTINYKLVNTPGARKPFRLYKINGAVAA